MTLPHLKKKKKFVDRDQSYSFASCVWIFNKFIVTHTFFVLRKLLVDTWKGKRLLSFKDKGWMEWEFEYQGSVKKFALDMTYWILDCYPSPISDSEYTHYWTLNHYVTCNQIFPLYHNIAYRQSIVLSAKSN